MNKKAAVSYYMINWVPKLVFTVIAVIALLLLINMYSIVDITTFEVESSLFLHRLMHSKSLVYYDEGIQRLYPFTIDLQKFADNGFEKNIMDEIAYPSMREDLLGKNTHIAASISFITKGSKFEKFYNKERYGMWKVLTGREGPGAVDKLEKTMLVEIKDKNTFSVAPVTFTILMQRT